MNLISTPSLKHPLNPAMRLPQYICSLFLAIAALAAAGNATKPSIIVIMSDDQDRRLFSTDFQPVLHRDIFSQGVEFTNHFATTAQCCPSRSSLLRGQAAHNTNVTHVVAPGCVSSVCCCLRISAI